MMRTMAPRSRKGVGLSATKMLAKQNAQRVKRHIMFAESEQVN
jgi:hypothetical protein